VEIRSKDLNVECEKLVPATFKGHQIDRSLRLDMLVGGLVIVECKAVAACDLIFRSQVLTYLRLTGLKPGLTINFVQWLVKNGIHHVVNGL
jgi:GxxExxY protein